MKLPFCSGFDCPLCRAEPKTWISSDSPLIHGSAEKDRLIEKQRLENKEIVEGMVGPLLREFRNEDHDQYDRDLNDAASELSFVARLSNLLRSMLRSILPSLDYSGHAGIKQSHVNILKWLKIDVLNIKWNFEGRNRQRVLNRILYFSDRISMELSPVKSIMEFAKDDYYDGKEILKYATQDIYMLPTPLIVSKGKSIENEMRKLKNGPSLQKVTKRHRRLKQLNRRVHLFISRLKNDSPTFSSRFQLLRNFYPNDRGIYSFLKRCPECNGPHPNCDI